MRKIQLSILLAILALASPQRSQAEDIGVVKLSDRTPQGKQVKSVGLISRSSIQLASYLRQEHEVPYQTGEGHVLPGPAPHEVYPQPGSGPVVEGQPCPQCKQVHAPAPVYCEEESRGIPVCCLPGVCCLGDGFSMCLCPHLCLTGCRNGHPDDCECEECQNNGRLKTCLKNCNTSGRFGYFNHDGYPMLDPLGHYGMVYPVNPQYFDKRDGQVYAAPHYGIPISVPLAPTVGKTYNYGWGIPSSRLTNVAHSYHWTYGGPVSSAHSTSYSPDYPYDHNYWVPPHDYYRNFPPLKVTAPPLRMAQAQQRMANPTQYPITHGQPLPPQPIPAQPVPGPAPAAIPVDLPPAP